MKGWSGKHEILCVEQSDHAEKKVENEIFNTAALQGLHSANICQVFFYLLHY